MHHLRFLSILSVKRTLVGIATFCLTVSALIIGTSPSANAGDRKKSIKYHNEAVAEEKAGHNDKALELYGRAIKEDPTDPVSWRFRGLLYWSLDRYQDAYVDFVEVKRLDPTQTILYGDFGRVTFGVIAAIAANREGLKRWGAGQLADAESWFSKGIVVDATLPVLYRYRGRIRIKLGNTTGAQEDLNRLVDLDPKYAPYVRELGLLLFQDDRISAALDAEERAAVKAEAEGSHLVAFQHYSKAYALAGSEFAEAYFAMALIRPWRAANPRPEVPEGLRRLLVQAQSHARAERYEEAEKAYAKAYRLCPWSPEASFNRALILGTMAAAEEKAAAADPISGNYHGILKFKWGDYPVDVEIQNSGGRLSGSVKIKTGKTSNQDGSISGSYSNGAISLTVDFANAWQADATFSGQYSEDKILGRWSFERVAQTPLELTRDPKELGVKKKRIQRYSDAIDCMNWYLQIAPDAPNARAARDKIYEWEAVGGKASKPEWAGRGWVGVATESASTGARIVHVNAGSPGDKAGLQVGDIVSRFGGEAVPAEEAALGKKIRERNPGDSVEIVVHRGGQEMLVRVTLGSTPPLGLTWRELR